MTITTRPASSRPPAVAGLFYPDDPAELRGEVQRLLAAAGGIGAQPRKSPKALIAPHAGYVYSGPIAAQAYARLAGQCGHVRRVVLLGPAHRVALRGLAVPATGAFETPLGAVPIDRDAITLLADLPQVVIDERAHAAEHSLEVHLPFLQQLLGSFSLVPLVVGAASTEDVAAVLERLWGDDTTLIVASSDLSHYRSYDDASRVDRDTLGAMLRLEPRLTHNRLAARRRSTDCSCSRIDAGCEPNCSICAIPATRLATGRASSATPRSRSSSRSAPRGRQMIQ